MAELRLLLLVLGVVFLVALAWWELRRARLARGPQLPQADAPPPAPQWEMGPAVVREAGSRASEALDLPRISARDPVGELPVVELPAGQDPTLAPSASAPTASARSRTRAQAPLRDALLEGAQLAAPAEPFLVAVPESIPVLSAVAPPAGPPITMPEAVAPAPEAAAPAPEAAALAPEAAAGPMVDWPDPDSSRIISLRLVPRAEKFAGRAVRLALRSEGFVLGRFSIFHKPGQDGRAVVSAASLSNPGTFDAEAMDMQRFRGLSLFTVLPGPLPAQEAVDELLLSARTLSERLYGVLQDAHGTPLTAAGAAQLRQSAGPA